MIVIGTDTHKRTHAMSAVDEGTGRVRGSREITADEAGHLAAVRWARESHDFWSHVTAVEEHIGRDLPLPETLEQDWVNALFAAGQVLSTGVVRVRVTDASARVKLPDGESPLVVGTELTFRLDEPITETIGPTVVDLGVSRFFADVRVVHVEAIDASTVMYHFKAISDEMVEATIIGDDDLDDEDELVDGQAA